MKTKLLLAAMMLSMSLSLFAQSGKCGDNLTWKLSNGVLTISGTGAMTNYTYSNPGGEGTNAPWYPNIKKIISVIISDGVTRIGNNAFCFCRNLKSVTIPNSVTTIGDGAFYECSSLTSVTIPNSVTSIGVSAFCHCTGLTSITIPNSVTSIGSGAFEGCDVLTSVTIPNSVTSIGDLAFSYCSSLTSVTIPNSVTSIGNEAFRDCRGLTSFTIPSSVTSIGRYTFSGCRSMTSVTIPNSVTSIGAYAFVGCSSLTSVTIPNSVTSIGYGAFASCSSLTSVTIPNSVTSIGEYAFSGCKIQEIHFTGTLEEWIGKSWNPSIISSSYALYISNSLVTNVVIPNGVTSIGSYAFSCCNCLKNVILGSSVKLLEAGAFYECTAIETITCYSMRPPTVKDNALGSVPYSTIVYVPADSYDNYYNHDAWGLYDVRRIGTASTETNGEETEGMPAARTRKVMRDGVRYILMPDGKMYDAQGAEL